MNSAERVERDRRIAAARATGDSVAAIARREGVSERQARRAASAGLRLGADGLGDVDVAAVLLNVVRAQGRALTRLEELAEKADNSSAAVGAARGTAVVGSALIDSLRAAGLLAEPRAMAVVWDARSAAEVLLEVAARHGLDEDEVVEALYDGPAPVFRPALRLAGRR
jgi:hypothetical protein